MISFETKYKILLLKTYIDTGLSLTNYLKYVLGFFSLMSKNAEPIIYMAVGYGIFCAVLGYSYYKFGWVEAGMEIGNRYNLFVKEMRKKFGSPKNRKIYK